MELEQLDYFTREEAQAIWEQWYCSHDVEFPDFEALEMYDAWLQSLRNHVLTEEMLRREGKRRARIEECRCELREMVGRKKDLEEELKRLEPETDTDTETE